MRILGIETSCDETAAAIVEDGTRILSSVVASQIAAHRPYGGVVPELASREHLQAIVPVVRQAFQEAGLRYADVGAVAVTQGPGLVGSLLVGMTYAKALAISLGLPLIGVNHLEGHVHAVLLEQRMRGEPEAEFPALVLIVSGGHTLLLLAEKDSSPVPNSRPFDRLRAGPPTPNFRYQLLGRTRDDAAGEAFDKVAKLLSLGYPGGPVIERLAPHGNSRAVAFTPPKTKGNPLDFSFSGFKTAVLRYVESHGLAAEAERRGAALRQKPAATVEDYLALTSRETLDLIASFQSALVDDLVARTRAAAGTCFARSAIVSGGVACNSLLRERFRKALEREGPPVYFPSPALSTDNAAMIAAAAFPKFAAGEFAGLDLAADPQLPLV